MRRFIVVGGVVMLAFLEVACSSSDHGDGMGSGGNATASSGGYAASPASTGGTVTTQATGGAVMMGTSDAGAPDASGSDAATVQSGDCSAGPQRNGPYTRVVVEGDPSAAGVIDPSVEYPADAAAGWMTYTTVPDFAHVHIAIATSSDHGQTWSYVGDVTQASPIDVVTTDTSICGTSPCSGTLVQESSSLVVDTFDPDSSRRFKVFTHTYFYGAMQQFRMGYLAMHTASAPEGPWTETKLLGWPSESPISTEGVAYNIQTASTLPELHDCYIVGEPGALVRAPGTLDLALSCPAVHADGTSTIDIRLLRSEDHGITWSFVSTLLSPADATALGSSVDEINGADLFFANGAYHLIATPTGIVDFPDGSEAGYRGCVVVAIEDLDAGRIARCASAPVVEASYLGQPGQFVGACSADVGASANGMLIPVPDFESSVPFQLFAAELPLP